MKKKKKKMTEPWTLEAKKKKCFLFSLLLHCVVARLDSIQLLQPNRLMLSSIIDFAGFRLIGA